MEIRIGKGFGERQYRIAAKGFLFPAYRYSVHASEERIQICIYAFFNISVSFHTMDSAIRRHTHTEEQRKPDDALLAIERHMCFFLYLI